MRVALDGSRAGRPLAQWLVPTAHARAGRRAARLAVQHHLLVGTTGTPKGIVQSHAMRWQHVCMGDVFGYGPRCVTLLSTPPLYSNTTLVSFFPTFAWGGAVVPGEEFDALGYLKLAQSHRATHAMLVPVQYQRLMSHPDFERGFDLSRRSPQVLHQRAVPRRAQGRRAAALAGRAGRVHGMTEGGGCMLLAHDTGQAAHRGPAVRGARRSPDRRGQARSVARRGQAEVVGRSRR
ncbi:MAG: AMP-binding protein [Burkholderiaceae bacterium]